MWFLKSYKHGSNNSRPKNHAAQLEQHIYIRACMFHTSIHPFCPICVWHTCLCSVQWEQWYRCAEINVLYSWEHLMKNTWWDDPWQVSSAGYGNIEVLIVSAFQWMQLVKCCEWPTRIRMSHTRAVVKLWQLAMCGNSKRMLRSLLRGKTDRLHALIIATRRGGVLISESDRRIGVRCLA